MLVPLYPDLRAGIHERRADLRRHAGEISFPGGRQDHPAEDLRETALREAHEEIGLDPADVELMGAPSGRDIRQRATRSSPSSAASSTSTSGPPGERGRARARVLAPAASCAATR